MVVGLASLGHGICFTSRSQDKIDDLMRSAALTSVRGVVRGIVAELGARDGVAGLLDRLASAGLRPTCLVNNARNADYLQLEGTGRPSARNWLAEFELDVVVPYELSMGLAAMPDSRLASIINITSMYGVVAANPKLYEDAPRQSPIHYNVAKAALIHLTKELSVRLAPRNIRVNSIAYGGVAGRGDKAFEARYASLVPTGRMLREDEIAGAVAFLASAASSGMTGHNLVVDGGWSAW
jgi:NAD(P)-dependent dehydrogenase (short-subunit alcohol dehydrogenase family)